MARTQSEVATTQACCGMNVLKVARYLNLVAGTALIVICVLELITLFIDFFLNPGAVFLNIYMCFFGLIILGSSINMPCIARNFFFILTGVGKGVFNMFVGTLLFLNDPGKFSPSMVLGWMFIASGLIFIFMSYCRKMTERGNRRQM